MATAPPPSPRSLWILAVGLGLGAFVLEQVAHECCHGLTALAVGGRWDWLHFFAVGSEVSPEAPRSARLAVPAGAALWDIALGAVAFLVSRRTSRPTLRLFSVYLAAFCWFAGFGYLFFDAATYDPEGTDLGDWKRVLQILGDVPLARLVVGAVGLAGYLGAFYWLPRALTRFAGEERWPLARALAWGPYLGANLLATALAWSHPIGDGGLGLVLSKGWLGFSGFFWAAWMARSEPPSEDAVPLRERTALASGVAIAAIAVAVGLALGPWGPGVP